MEEKTRTQENPATKGARNDFSPRQWWDGVLAGKALVIPGLKGHSLRQSLFELTGRKDIQKEKGEKSAMGALAESAGLSLGIVVERTVTIENCTPEELYGYWRDFEKLPSFMRHLKSVRTIDARLSHWVTRGPMDSSIEWDAELVFEHPNELIAWASVENSDIQNSGFVRFRPAAGERGAEVKLVLEYLPPGGVVGAALARLFGEEGEQQIRDELRRFKMLMETGEIATTEGQPSGRGREVRK